MGFRLYLGRWMQQLEWSNTKGFYIDVNQIDEALQDNILLPELKVFKIGGTTSYVLNPNYSFKAVVKQNEWQRKSSGSFVPAASYTYTRIKDDAEIDKIFNFALGPSYHYNLIIADRFLVSAGLFLGLGYNYTLVEFDDQREDYVINGLLVRSDLKLALGYNSTRFFVGGHVNLNSFSYNLDPKITFADNQQILEFYIGYRFKAPKKVIKIADDVQSKIGL